MSEFIYKLLGIRHVKILLYNDNIFVGSLTRKFVGQEFIKDKKFGCYILPKVLNYYFIHGKQYRLIYHVDFPKPLKPEYDKFDFLKKKIDIKNLKEFRIELWDSIQKTSQLTPEYIEEIKSRVYTEDDIIEFRLNNLTANELEAITSGQEIIMLMKSEKLDWSWLSMPIILACIVAAIIFIFVGIPK